MVAFYFYVRVWELARRVIRESERDMTHWHLRQIAIAAYVAFFSFFFFLFNPEVAQIVEKKKAKYRLSRPKRTKVNVPIESGR